ncbi:uncharacterized protein LOC135954732 [Calliphora vicina]|uniref:uncharacterized protein LOC135954732 n=1 Tax=Calliphora vicina TaxID=7373 RepID=UPI00325AC652
MNCSACGVNKIGPEIDPFGGYFCSNSHLQCNECNASKNGHCGLCRASTKFIRMNFNSPKSSGEQPLQSTPHSSLFSKDQPICTAFSNQMFEEIETQSRLSKEHLSMKDSRESIGRKSNETGAIVSVSDVLTIEKHCDEHLNIMETLFIGKTSADNSASFIDNPVHQDVGTSLNVGGISKVENEKSFNYCPKELEDMKKENVFLFDKDPNDSYYIRTSEIRFLDSTDSFQNVYTKTEPEDLACPSSNNEQQWNSLSVKVLRDFETQNSADRTEVVKSYLENCSPTTFYHSPVYNCQHSHCDLGWRTRKSKMEMTMKTVSVSTDSDPSLKSICLDITNEKLTTKFKSHDYLIMQTAGISPHVQCSAIEPLDKDVKPSMDIRMQKILKTFKEDPKQTKFSEKSNVIKLPTQVPAKQPQEREHNEIRNLKNEDKSSVLINRLLNTHRAFYNPSNSQISPVNNLHLLRQHQPEQQEPPLPQFQIVPCSNALAKELLLNQKKLLSFKPVPACVLNIPRSPIQCPESTCQRMIFVSNFNKHLVVDHSHLPMERITPYQCKNFFLDARLAHCGTSKCHLLYLMRDKITDLGSSEYKDFLPILVMTTRISLNELCGLRDQTSALEFFLIWVTGIAPEEFPTSVSLTVWSRSGRVPSCHVVYSGQMYSIRKSQRALDVWQSGRMLLLSAHEIDTLTCNGKEMLNLQLRVH